MSMRKIEVLPTERLRASPSFVLAFTMDGRPYIAKETEPYIQFWLSERYRALLSMFSGRHGATVGDALDSALRLSNRVQDPAERQRLMAAVRDMREAGVLVSTREDTSRYDARIVQAYVTHRPFPRELSDQIIRDGAIGPASRVLDLAGGPGDLALALARASGDVTLMELSKGFVSAARRRAKEAALNLTVVHESCNRLVFNDDAYDVITVSQALHWLDDVMVCRGICRVLRRGGSFFVVHANFDVDEEHPLSFVLGRRSVLGHQPDAAFADLVQALLRRLTLLFDALDSPQVHRIDPAQHWSATGGPALIVPARASLFRQRRPLGPGFLRGFLTERHIDASGMTPEAFWAEVETRCAGASARALEGRFDWAVLQFTRGGPRAELGPLGELPVTEIGFDGPAQP
jgi:ubiquinone/menaquinone biosynthesis C-methylase UbiE